MENLKLAVELIDKEIERMTALKEVLSAGIAALESANTLAELFPAPAERKKIARTRWTEEETRELVKMHNRGFSSMVIADYLVKCHFKRRTPEAIKRYIYKLKHGK